MTPALFEAASNGKELATAKLSTSYLELEMKGVIISSIQGERRGKHFLHGERGVDHEGLPQEARGCSRPARGSCPPLQRRAKSREPRP